jgi:ferredoxin
MPELKVNQDTCIGCGACESVCPKFFKLENGKSNVIVQPEESDKDSVEEAIKTCPVGAISFE